MVLECLTIVSPCSRQSERLTRAIGYPSGASEGGMSSHMVNAVATTVHAYAFMRNTQVQDVGPKRTQAKLLARGADSSGVTFKQGMADAYSC